MKVIERIVNNLDTGVRKEKTVIINFIKTIDGCSVPVIPVVFYKKECHALLDTGASHTIIDIEILKKVGQESLLRKSKDLIVGFGGQNNSLTHEIDTHVSIGEFNLNCPCATVSNIMENINFMKNTHGLVPSIILGADFIDAYKIHIDLSQKAAWFTLVYDN
jgi:hypothetical protein